MIVSETDAVGALAAGEVVAVPTDTVYGLAAVPSRPGATAAVFALKGRPAGLALPVLVADADQGRALVAAEAWTAVVQRLADSFWPGPLTLVLERLPALAWELGGDEATIGVRYPAADPVLRLCRAVGPLATTSANRHGAPPLTTADEVVSCFGKALAVLDGGRCQAPPSTVVDVTEATPTCRRQGAIAWEEVVALL